jgi:hypothetical protein
VSRGTSGDRRGDVENIKRGEPLGESSLL